MDTTPLEALIVKPGEVLVLRLPEMPGEAQDDLIDVVRPVLESMGLSERTLILSNEIEVSVVESADGLRG